MQTVDIRTGIGRKQTEKHSQIRTKKALMNALKAIPLSPLMDFVVTSTFYSISCLIFIDSHSSLNGIVGLVHKLNMTSFLKSLS